MSEKRNDTPLTDAELGELEARLRRDTETDPGEAFFQRLEADVMQQVAARPVPRRGGRLGRPFAWLRRPVPALATAGLAAAAAWLVIVSLPSGQLTNRPTTTGLTEITGDAGAPQAPRAPKRETPLSGKQWLAKHAPDDDVEALPPRQLRQLARALESGGTAGLSLFGADLDDPVDGAESVEDAVDALDDAELKAVYDRLAERVQKRKGNDSPG